MEKMLSRVSKKSKNQHSKFFYSAIISCSALLVITVVFVVYKVATPFPQNKINEYSGAEKIAAEKAVNLPTGPEIVKAQIAVTKVEKVSTEGVCSDTFILDKDSSNTKVSVRYAVTLAKPRLFAAETYTVHICQY